jgi:hypothetical protein
MQTRWLHKSLSRANAWIARGLVGSLVVLGANCLSPTLPLPPPEEPGSISNAGGEWTIIGSCIEGAEVVGYNEATGRGAVFLDREGTGVYTLSIEATECDTLVLKQLLGDEASDETRVVFTETMDGIAENPTACSQ